MKIISWNVNGIRAASKKGLEDFVQSQRPDIFCIQETKAELGQVEPNIQNLGFPFSNWSSAKRKGYSGVATFSRNQPKSIQSSFGFAEYENEGRTVITQYDHFWLYNIYFPNGGSGEERHRFKQKFLVDLSLHLKSELALKKNIIVVGDYNVAHKEIDVYDPVRLSKESGFLPEERQWFETFLSLGFVDSFRHFYPAAKDRYSWWSYRELARISNRGWRIDYICISQNLMNNLKSAAILDQVEGSDHCPVMIELEIS